MRRLPEAFLQDAQRSQLFVKGQAIVEFALLLPLLLFITLGFGESAILFSAQHTMQNSVDVLAQVAAEKVLILPGESWNANWVKLVKAQSLRSNCAELPSIQVTFPDTTKKSGDRVRVKWTCPYSPVVTKGLWPGLSIGVESEAVIRLLPMPTPTPIPTPSPVAS